MAPDLQHSEIAAAWLQPAPPSPWRGLDVCHYCTEEDTELPDSVTPSKVWLSFLKRPADLFERKNRHGRWQKIDVPAGTVGYVPSDHVLNGRWRGGADSVNILIDLDWLQGGAIGPLPLHSEVVEGIHDKVLAQLINDVHKDSLSGAPTDVEHGEWLVLSALYRLAAICRNAAWDCKPMREAAAVDRALDYINAHMDCALRVRDIATAAGFEGNLYAFVRMFKQHTGMPPHQYVLTTRMQHAKSMLLRGKDTVTEVALTCGFTNLSHFSDTFKRRWGQTPSSCRET